MRIFGLILLIGGFLVRLLTTIDILAFVLMGLGFVIIIISYITKKK